ncbi:MAG: DoxX family protein [Halobacteria archaeon]
MVLEETIRKNRSPARNLGVLVLRLTLLVVFIHGIGKLLGVGPEAFPIDQFTTFLAKQGVPSPELFAWVVGIIETFGGIFIVFGFLTRISAFFVALNFAVASLLVHLPNGFSVSDGGYEFTFVLFMVALTLLLIGPGKYAIDYKLFSEPTY